MKYHASGQQGFTIIEVLVSLVLMSIGIITIAMLTYTLQTAQRNNDAQTVAITQARSVTENFRTSTLALFAGTYQDQCNFSQDLNSTLANSNLQDASGTATLSCTDGVYGVRRIDVIINYTVGSGSNKLQKSVQLSTYIGNNGLY